MQNMEYFINNLLISVKFLKFEFSILVESRTPNPTTGEIHFDHIYYHETVKVLPDDFFCKKWLKIA